MHCLHAIILLVVLQNASAHSGTTGETIGRHHGYTAGDIIRAIEREVVQEHLGSAVSSGSTDEETQESSTDSGPDEVSGLPSKSQPSHVQLDSTGSVEPRGNTDKPISNIPPSTNQGEGFPQPTVYRGEDDYKNDDEEEEGRSTSDEERENGDKGPRMEFAHMEKVADVMKKLKKAKTDEEMASKLRTGTESLGVSFKTFEQLSDLWISILRRIWRVWKAKGAKQVMHSIVDGIVTKTTQTLEPKITSLVDRGLKTALANNASNPASLVENQSYNASSRDSGLNNREIVKVNVQPLDTEDTPETPYTKVQNVNNRVNSKSRRTARNSKPVFKSSSHHSKKTHVTVHKKSGKVPKEQLTTVVSFVSGKNHHNSNHRTKAKQAKKRHRTTNTDDTTVNKEKDNGSIEQIQHNENEGKIKESKEEDAREKDQSDDRKTKTQNVVEGPHQGDSVKKELVAQESMSSAMPSAVEQMGVFPGNENRRLNEIQNKVDRIENELTILQTAVAGVIKRLDDMGRVVEDVSNLTQNVISGPQRQNQQSPVNGSPQQPQSQQSPVNGSSPLGGSSSSVIKIIFPTFKSNTTNITGLKLGISEPAEIQEKLPNVSVPKPAPKPEITESAPPEMTSPSVEELFPEIKGSSGLLIPQIRVSLPKDNGMPTDTMMGPGSGNGTLQLPGMNLTSDHVELLPNGGFLNLSLQATEPPTVAPIEPLPGSNGMLVNKTQSTNNTNSGKSSGNRGKDEFKTHNLHVTESPTHTTMEPLPGTGGKFAEHRKVEPGTDTGESGFGNSEPTQEPDQSSDEEMAGTDQSYEVNHLHEPGNGWSPGNAAKVPTLGTKIKEPAPETPSDQQSTGSEQEAPIPTLDQEQASDNPAPTPTPGSETNSDNQSPTPATESTSDNPATNSESNQPGKDGKENPSGIDQSQISVNTGRFPEAQSDMFENQFPFPGPFPVQSGVVPPYFMRYPPQMGMGPTTHTQSSPHQMLIPLGSINGFQQEDDNSNSENSENSDDADERHVVHNNVNRNPPVSRIIVGKDLKMVKPTGETYNPFIGKDHHMKNERGKPQPISALQANGQQTIFYPSHDAPGEQKVAMDTPQIDQKMNDARPIINIIVPNSETASLLRKEMCQPPCKNGGKCIGINTCKCPTLFVGDQCGRFSLLDLLNKNRIRPHKKQYAEKTAERHRSLQHRPLTIEDLLRSLVNRYRSPRPGIDRHRQQLNSPFAKDIINYRFGNLREPSSYRLQNPINSNAYRYNNIRVPNYYRFQNEGDFYDPSERKKSIIPRRILTRINPITKRKQYILEV